MKRYMPMVIVMIAWGTTCWSSERSTISDDSWFDVGLTYSQLVTQMYREKYATQPASAGRSGGAEASADSSHLTYGEQLDQVLQKKYGAKDAGAGSSESSDGSQVIKLNFNIFGAAPASSSLSSVSSSSSHSADFERALREGEQSRETPRIDMGKDATGASSKSLKSESKTQNAASGSRPRIIAVGAGVTIAAAGVLALYKVIKYIKG